MYINPVIVGVIGTLFVETIAFIFIAIWWSTK